jgi:secreted trypsin-like serine protease
MENFKNLRIVGGKEATPHSWPSIAYLQFSYTFDLIINEVTYQDTVKMGWCGGTLISNNEILTAAQ